MSRLIKNIYMSEILLIEQTQRELISSVKSHFQLIHIFCRYIGRRSIRNKNQTQTGNSEVNSYKPQCIFVLGKCLCVLD